MRPWSANCAARPWWARSFLATTIRPLVSLSSRCTMPGRRTPPMPDRLSPQWAISALTSVPLSWPAAGWTTRPGRLVDDDEVVVLVARRRARSPRACGSAGAGGGSVERRRGRRPRPSRPGRGPAAPSTVTRPVADQRLQAGARQVRPGARQHPVEPLGGRVRRRRPGRARFGGHLLLAFGKLARAVLPTGLEAAGRLVIRAAFASQAPFV